MLDGRDDAHMWVPYSYLQGTDTLFLCQGIRGSPGQGGWMGAQINCCNLDRSGAVFWEHLLLSLFAPHRGPSYSTWLGYASGTPASSAHRLHDLPEYTRTRTAVRVRKYIRLLSQISPSSWPACLFALPALPITAPECNSMTGAWCRGSCSCRWRTPLIAPAI